MILASGYLFIRSWAAVVLAPHLQGIASIVANIMNVQLLHHLDAVVVLALPPLIVGLSPGSLSLSLTVMNAQLLHHLDAVVALALTPLIVGLSPVQLTLRLTVGLSPEKLSPSPFPLGLSPVELKQLYLLRACLLGRNGWTQLRKRAKL